LIRKISLKPKQTNSDLGDKKLATIFPPTIMVVLLLLWLVPMFI